MKNKVIDIIDASERTYSQINFIVNTFFLGDKKQSKRLRDYLNELVKMVQADMIEIHDIKS